MTTIARQYPLKQSLRVIAILAVSFVLVTLFVQHYRTLQGASSSSQPGANDSSIHVTLGGTRTDHGQNNPLRGFRP